MAAEPRRLQIPWARIDVVVVGATAALASFGMLLVYSAQRRNLVDAGLDPLTHVKRQALALAAGAVVLVLAAVVDYRRLRELAVLPYVVTTVLLALVVSPLGTTSKGAQAWFQLGGFQLQPSELAKVTLVVLLATVAAAGRGDVELGRLAAALVVGGIPISLIMLQPDLGTALVVLAIIAAILLVAGTHGRHLAVLALVSITCVVGVLEADVLEDYQKARLTAFLNPEGDPAYHIEQSKIAVGNGGLRGAGLFQGTQTNLSLVPEQHTDFIFTVAAEELGFLGGATVLGLYAVLCWRIWRIAQQARDLVGTLICVGVLGMIVFQVFQNIGMTLGIMPITGIPLPLVSYGGSSAVAMLASIGLVLNVHARRFA